MAIKISPEAIAALLGKTAAEVENLFKKDGEYIEPNEADKILTTNVNEKIRTLIDKEKNAVDKQGIRDRARKEVLQEVNDALIAKGGTGINWKEQLESLDTSGSKEITESDVKSHPFFVSTINRYKDDLENEKNAHQETVKTYKSKEQQGIVRQLASEFLSNPDNAYVIPEDEVKANKRLQNFLRDLASDATISRDENGNISVLGADGKPLQDDNFNAIDVNQYMAKVAESYYDKRVAQARQKPPIGGAGAGGQRHNFPVMKNEDDLQKAIDDMAAEGKSREEIQALVDHFETHVQA